MNTQEPNTFRPEVVPGERIFLSQVQRADVPLFASWYSDLELGAYIGAHGMSFTPEQEQDWYERTVKQTDVKTFAIIVREGQRMVGTVSLMDINARHGHATLGISIGDKTVWGKGYGTEAVRLICDYGFTFLSLHNIRLWHVAFNKRGHHAYLKAGFKEAGRVRGAILFNGQRYDDVLMDITREDFGPTQSGRLIGQLNT